MNDTLTQAEVESLAQDCMLAAKCMKDTETFETGQSILKEAATAIYALQAERDAAITRAEAAEKARDEWCEVSQKNYQLARDMEKRLIDTAQPTD